MKKYILFTLNEKKNDTLIISFDDGDGEKSIIISGPSKDLKKIKKELPSGVKIVKTASADAVEISSEEWLSFI